MNRRAVILGTGLVATPFAGCIDDVEPSSGGDPAGDSDPSDDDSGSTDDDSESMDDDNEPADDEDSTNDDSDPADDDSASDCGNVDVEEDPRVDEPPHEIERPDPPHDDPSDDAEWNDEYLGEHMETEPSLSFEQFPWVRLREDVGLWHDDDGASAEYWVELVTSEGERDAMIDLDEVDEETRADLEAVDFEESVLVVVQSGRGSSSVRHRWARVEEVADGFHLHGYYLQPLVRTEDLTYRTSALEVERPANACLARVSLTVSEERRVHFNSTEGIVRVDE